MLRRESITKAVNDAMRRVSDNIPDNPVITYYKP